MITNPTSTNKCILVIVKLSNIVHPQILKEYKTYAYTLKRKEDANKTL